MRLPVSSGRREPPRHRRRDARQGPQIEPRRGQTSCRAGSGILTLVWTSLQVSVAPYSKYIETYRAREWVGFASSRRPCTELQRQREFEVFIFTRRQFAKSPATAHSSRALHTVSKYSFQARQVRGLRQEDRPRPQRRDLLLSRMPSARVSVRKAAAEGRNSPIPKRSGQGQSRSPGAYYELRLKKPPRRKKDSVGLQGDTSPSAESETNVT